LCVFEGWSPPTFSFVQPSPREIGPVDQSWWHLPGRLFHFKLCFCRRK